MAKHKKPKIIPRSEHCISRKMISPEALKVLYRLKDCGYDAYLVGGCVRDLLLDHTPKDFDIATNAHPEEIRNVFRNCRLIGRRFRLAHIHFGSHIIEVATFRGQTDNTEPSDTHHQHEDGRILRDNVYGTIEEDAFRRDFTINALYYNIKDFSLVDFTHGAEDIQNNRLCIIGDPNVRYTEDPVRMMRAVRFVAKLGMNMSSETEKPIETLAPLLHKVSSSRLFDEIVKLFHTGHATNTYAALKKYHLLPVLFPSINALLKTDTQKILESFLKKACHNTDMRIKNDQSVSCAFLFAFLLWPIVEQRRTQLQKEGCKPALALQTASEETLKEQSKITLISRRFSYDIIEIWGLQNRFHRRQRKTVYRTLRFPKFRAAFDLLLLRAEMEKSLQPLGDWWDNLQHADEEGQEKMLAQLTKKKTKS